MNLTPFTLPLDHSANRINPFKTNGIFLSILQYIKNKIKQYNSTSFTDTNSVICKIIVGDGFPSRGRRNASPTEKGERYMKATGIVRRVDDLGRIVIPKEIRRTLRIREGDPSQTTLTPWQIFSFAMLDLSKRNLWNGTY